MKQRLSEGFLDLQRVPKNLSDRFGAPPFSLLDASQHYWQKRKREWIRYGVKGESGRGEKVASTTVCATDWMKRGPDEGGSVFDPVLAELMFKWFCLANGSVLDPFGGESTKGIVATTLGFKYTGIELRPEQVQANNAQAKKLGISPEWVQGDSAKINKLLGKDEMFDFIFTSPPYYDLEIYSESEKDGSAFETFDKFMDWYYDIFEQATSHLKDNRFLAVKIGEIRDKKTGAFRNFVGENISIFMDLGLHYYNEIILITPKGSLPIRAGKQFNASRKVAKGHQNVLVFWKGDLKNIKEVFGNE